MSIHHLAGRVVEQLERPRHPGCLGISYEHWGVHVCKISGFMFSDPEPHPL